MGAVWLVGEIHSRLFLQSPYSFTFVSRLELGQLVVESFVLHFNASLY